MSGWLRALPSLLLAVAAGSTWFFAASRAMYRLGPQEAATAVGLLTAFAVTLTVLRWTNSDDNR